MSNDLSKMAAPVKTYKAIVSLGSNLGESAENIRRAAERIGQLPDITPLRLSRIYHSLPALNADQPLFFNAVLLVETSLNPQQLLAQLQKIEQDFGRRRLAGTANTNSVKPSSLLPRTLDLDIIDMEGVVTNTALLTLPHSQALRRDFVVTPLLEIAPHTVLANGTVVNRRMVDCGKVIAVLQDDGQWHRLPNKDGLEHRLPGGDRLEHRLPDDTAVPGEGKLSICATPIGNIKDITLRVLETLRQAHSIYCEDTRVTRRLLAHYDIHKPLVAADEHRLPKLISQIIAQIRQGLRLAYVTDAGTPTISDPGQALIAALRAADIPLEVVPGPSAFTTALVASGIKAQNLYFGGFFPRKAGALRQRLDTLAGLEHTVLVFYESARRAHKSLAVIAEVFPEQQITLARELTKLHEEILSGFAADLAQQITQRLETGGVFKGELVVLIAPLPKHAQR